MDADEACEVLDALASAGCRCDVGGGWGVDALVGRQTRPHRDLDLAVDAADVETVLGVLDGLGYAVQTDWRPVRVELVAPGERWVDLHPIVFDEAGEGVQAGLDGEVFTYARGDFVRGCIAGRAVGCLSVELQLRFHSGYPPREVDRADVRLLTALRSASADR